MNHYFQPFSKLIERKRELRNENNRLAIVPLHLPNCSSQATTKNIDNSEGQHSIFNHYLTVIFQLERIPTINYQLFSKLVHPHTPSPYMENLK